MLVKVLNECEFVCGWLNCGFKVFVLSSNTLGWTYGDNHTCFCILERKAPGWKSRGFVLLHACASEWTRKKLLVTVWDVSSGLPECVLCSAGLITLSNSQPSLWHHKRPITSLPAKPLTHMKLLSTPNERLHLHDTVGYSRIGQRKRFDPKQMSTRWPVSAEWKVTASLPRCGVGWTQGRQLTGEAGSPFRPVISHPRSSHVHVHTLKLSQYSSLLQ